MSLPTVWGATAEEVDRTRSCDSLIDGETLVLDRAVSVEAPSALVHRWTCQLSLAPYSYDWIDNLGHRSPRTLVEGADQLEPGDPVMVFQVTEVVPGVSWTGRSRRGPSVLFGELAVTYAVDPVDEHRCRLICRLVVSRRRLGQRLIAVPLAWGDLVMMRRQLLNLRSLAERSVGVHDHDGARRPPARPANADIDSQPRPNRLATPPGSTRDPARIDSRTGGGGGGTHGRRVRLTYPEDTASARGVEP